MVDFKIPNLCGASPELNDVLSKLADAKADAKAKLNEAASTAAAAFGAAQDELAGLKNKLQSIEIPTLPKLNLQAEIAGLASQIPGTPAFLSALAKIKTEFEDDIKAAGLELDSLVSDATKAILGGGDICALVPNLVKDSGSTEPAKREPIAPNQAAVPAVTEAASVSNDNATVTATVAENKQKTEAYAVTNKAPTEDSGAITVVKADKTIKSPAGGDVNVAPAGSGKTFSPDGGMPNRRSSMIEKFKLSQITNLGKDGSFPASTISTYGERFSMKVTLKNQPIDKILIHLHFGDTMKNFLIVPEEGSTNAKTIGTHYKSYYGLHMYSWISTAAGNSTGSQNIKLNGKELIFSSPVSLADHPGNIVSVDNEILNVKGTFRCYGSHPKSVLIGGVFGPGRFKSDKTLNKVFGGFAAVIEYVYLDNYDPEPA
jgi:hypothetical protein